MIGIDDLAAALNRVPAAGRELLAPVLARLRTDLVPELSQRGWEVVPYEEFVAWVADNQSESTEWVVLDPLFPCERLTGRVQVVDAHRSWAGAPGEAASKLDLLAERPDVRLGAAYVLLDDALYTGMTASRVREDIESRGGVVCEIVVGCAKAHGEPRLRGAPVRSRWIAPAAADILHLRDMVPWLPRSGRRAGERRCPITGRPVAIAPLFHAGGSWLQLDRHPDLAGRLRVLAHEVLDKLAERLGRPGRVADLDAFGPDAYVPIASPEKFVCPGGLLYDLIEVV